MPDIDEILDRRARAEEDEEMEQEQEEEEECRNEDLPDFDEEESGVK